LEQAAEIFDGVLGYPEQIANPAASLALLGLGRVALQRGEPERAKGCIQQSLDYTFGEDVNPNLAILKAWLGAAHLASGDLTASLRETGEASEILDLAGTIIGEYPVSHIHWWRYQALRPG
jgi:hypothetical protein